MAGLPIDVAQSMYRYKYTTTPGFVGTKEDTHYPKYTKVSIRAGHLYRKLKILYNRQNFTLSKCRAKEYYNNVFTT